MTAPAAGCGEAPGGRFDLPKRRIGPLILPVMQHSSGRCVAKGARPVPTAIAVFAFLIQALLGGSPLLIARPAATGPANFALCSGNMERGAGDHRDPGSLPCCDDGSCLLCHVGLGPVVAPSPPDFVGPLAAATAVRFYHRSAPRTFLPSAAYASRGPPLTA